MSKDIGRRDFIKKSVISVAVGTAALNFLDVGKILANVSDKFIEGTGEKVINLSDYPDLNSVGGYAMITNKVIVIRASQSKFIALNIICTHKQCSVEYDGSSFECPCHGSQYDKYGKVQNGPAKKNLRSYKTIYNADDNTLTINM